MLRNSVRVEVGDDSIALDFLGNRYELSKSASKNLLDALQSSRSDRASNESLPSELERALSFHGLIVEPELAVNGMSGLEFYRRHRRYALAWLAPVFAHPFWARVTTGAASTEEIIGFGIEKYHYIEAAHEHMGFAAASASSALMPHLARHFVEEYSHGDIYLRGLSEYYRTKSVSDSVPLPSTRALVNFLTESAIEDSFSYYAANEVLQMTENVDDGEENEVNAFYKAIVARDVLLKKLIDSFEAHTRLDQSLGHEEVFLQICRDVGHLTTYQVNRAMERSRQAAEHLLLFMDGIQKHYSKARVAVRLSYSRSVD